MNGKYGWRKSIVYGTKMYVQSRLPETVKKTGKHISKKIPNNKLCGKKKKISYKRIRKKSKVKCLYGNCST